MCRAVEAQASDRDVALTIPARPEHLVLARLALSAVCRLTPLTPEDVADLKLAITEAANDFLFTVVRDEARTARHGKTQTRMRVRMKAPCPAVPVQVRPS